MLVATGTLVADTVTATLRVDTTIGWNGLVKLATWNPVVVEIENTGARGDFVLIVAVESGTSLTASRTLTFREHFELSGGDRKRFDIAIPVDSVGLPVAVSIWQNGKEVYREEHSILGKTIRVPLVVALSRSTAFDFLMPKSMVVYMHPERLPMRWDAYMGVDLLIFHDSEWTKISAAQIDAIEAWIDIGGRAMIVGGPHLGSVEGSIRSLVPFDIVGVLRSDADISTQVGIDIPELDSPLMSRLVRLDQGASVLASAGAAPILVSMPRGGGRIIASAFDLSAASIPVWSGRDEFWQSIIRDGTIQPSPTISPQSESVSENPTVTSLINEIDTGTSGRLIYLFCMAAFVTAIYLAVGYVGGNPRSFLRWGAFALVLIVSAVGAQYLFVRTLYRRNYLVGAATLVEYRPGARFARSTTDLVVVSSSIGSNIITIERDRSIVLPQTREALAIDRIDGDLEVTTMHESPWSRDAYTIDTILPLDLSSMRNDDSDSIHVAITNTTSYLLLSGTIIYRGSIRPTGPLAPGERLSERFARSRDDVVTNLAEYRQRYGSMTSTREATVATLLSDDRWRSLLDHDAVLYLGWVNAPLFDFVTSDSFRYHTSSDLIVIVLETDSDDV